MFLKDKSIQVLKDILIRFPRKMIAFFSYLGEYNRFKKANDHRFPLHWKEIYPCLGDRTGTTPFDQHYIYHPAWAARVLSKTKPSQHTDISSILSFSSIVSAFVPVRFYDYRPAELNLPGLQSERADLLKLPFADQSIDSLSCMHTVEHIGLGRYGDPLDTQGDLKAINELKRVLKPGGNLLFVTPVGKPKIAFNAHRVYSYQQIITAFAPLVLQEFSLVPDTGGLMENADPALVLKQDYGCGCFWFKNLSS
jgi:SAM-dependent methyltransferase